VRDVYELVAYPGMEQSFLLYGRRPITRVTLLGTIVMFNVRPDHGKILAGEPRFWPIVAPRA
jgi:hypothetical protein